MLAASASHSYLFGGVGPGEGGKASCDSSRSGPLSIAKILWDIPIQDFLLPLRGSTAAGKNQGDTNFLLQLPDAGTIPYRALTQFPRGPCTSSAAFFPYLSFRILASSFRILLAASV